jgi:dTDP-4-dehydrorhamnose reductase
VFVEQWSALSASCEARLRLLALSCERVFDGWCARPYVELDRPNCRDAVGASWRALERTVLQAEPNALIARSGFAMDPQLPADALASAIDTIRMQRAPALSSRVLVTPSYLPHVVDAALDLLVDAETGIWHLASPTSCSPLELARSCAERLGLPFHSRPAQSQSQDQRGPMRALESRRGWPLPNLAAAVEAYAQAFQSCRPAEPAWGAVPTR